VRNCEGNHMSFPTPPIEVLEACLKGSAASSAAAAANGDGGDGAGGGAGGCSPMDTLTPRCMDCAQQVYAQLSQLVDALLLDDEVSRFPALVRVVREHLVSGLLKCGLEEAQQKISDLVTMEKAYIWTDDPAFRSELQALFGKKGGATDPNALRSLLRAYFATVRASLVHTVPKAVMHFLVRTSEDGMAAHLFERVARASSYSALLQESSDVAGLGPSFSTSRASCRRRGTRWTQSAAQSACDNLSENHTSNLCELYFAPKYSQ